MIQHFCHEPELDAIASRFVVETGAAPGGVVAFAVRRGGAYRCAIGSAGTLWRSSSAPELSRETPFDLASVTKPLIAMTAARLVRARALSLDAPLASLLPEARGTPSESTPLELLLAHRAGLEAHRTLFLPLLRRRPVDRTALLREAAGARRDDPSAPLYSDLGFVLVGAALERALGAPLDALFEREVAAPLGLGIGSARQWLARERDFVMRVAPTETVAWRGGVLRGVVHDENAWALSGHATSGHAGLFGTAADVARFGCALLDAESGRDEGWLSAGDLEPFVRERAGATLRAGFDGRSPGASASGRRAGARTFGHLGFTGTSLWCDPDAGLVTVLLSNRVCPTRGDLRLRAARPDVQDALYAAAGC